jgi:alkane 1-monooxygenase
MNFQKKLSFSLIYLLIPLPYIGLYIGGWCAFLPFIILFTLVPLSDAIIKDTKNLTAEEEKNHSHDPYFKYLIYLYVPLQIVMIGYGVYIVSHYSLSFCEWIGFTLSLGFITGGVGLNLAHEMMHKNSSIQQFLSKTLLVSVCYGHFIIEHVKGHHVRVATPEDPATAKLGESFYRYIPKTLFGSLKSAICLEKNRLIHKKLSLWNIRNQFWWIINIPVLIAVISFWYGGSIALAFFLMQSFMAILTLEVVNYIEHYGLERKKLPNGQYEKVGHQHSWNASHWLSNTLLLHLQRHSDHHTYGAKPYQILRHIDNGPQLPSGYLGMLVIALIPPLWRAIMDKRVLVYRKKLSNSATFTKNTNERQEYNT